MRMQMFLLMLICISAAFQCILIYESHLYGTIINSCESRTWLFCHYPSKPIPNIHYSFVLPLTYMLTQCCIGKCIPAMILKA